MDTMSTKNYELLSKQSLFPPEEHSKDYDSFIYSNHRYSRKTKFVLILILLLILSTSCNIILSTQIYRPRPDIGRSSYTGLGYDTPTLYRARTPWWGENETHSDELWEGLNTDALAIAVSNEWAQQHGLEESGPFPWDTSKSIYFIKAIHHVHCLKLMRRYTQDLRASRKPAVSWEHYQHCLDALRQDVMCRADDTPMYARPGRHIGDKQVLQCKDWNKLIAWTKAPARNACYRTLDDYRDIKHNLERHAFCPEGSPYYDISNAYFKKYGHKEAFYRN